MSTIGGTPFGGSSGPGPGPGSGGSPTIETGIILNSYVTTLIELESYVVPNIE